MNRSHIIEILALFRLQRWERLDKLLGQCTSREIAEALARMGDAEQLEFLGRLDAEQRQATVLALDYPAWSRLIDRAGPMISAWSRPAPTHASTHAARVH